MAQSATALVFVRWALAVTMPVWQFLSTIRQAALQGHHEWLQPKAGAGHQVHWGHLSDAGDDPSVI